MSFLAFLLFGGFVGFLSAYLYPKKKPKLKDLTIYALAGVLISFLTSFFGQTLSLFRAGQMLEWFGALFLTVVLVTCLRAMLSR
jgi:uncharacterized membrane protein YeaQ/YmgE (transglycosylase-associated protein family)